jgi:putative transposase
VEFATLEWVWWFDHHRLLEPLGYLPPAEYEEAFYRQQETQLSVPALRSRALRKTRSDSVRSFAQ